MSNLRRLPVIQPARAEDTDEHRTFGAGSLGTDGKRRRPYPADVHGRFLRARRVVYFALIAIWAALPFIPIGGHPAVFLDVDKRQFFLFGMTFNAQDVWLLFFGLTGLGFALVYATAVLGRVWCGWACPQTVFLETLFRPVERLFNGPRNVALRRAQGEMTFDRVWRSVATHLVYVLAAALVAHVFLAYFVSTPRVFAMVRTRPGDHPEAFGWMLATTALMYGNFAFFREQLCVVVCPYGRLQSVLIDDDSLVIGYDERRGEPRGKVHKATLAPGTPPAPAPAPAAGPAPAPALAPALAPETTKGDCVDCNRCVVVCPTGIDIREGLQLDCIACTACIDACDDVMDKLGRDRGLIRYDSLRGLRGEPRRLLRPRLGVYTALLVVGAVVAVLAFRKREAFEVNVARLPGTPYTRVGGTIQNAFELHIVNKAGDTTTFDLEAMASPDLAFVMPMARVELDSLGSRRVPFFVSMEQTRFTGDRPITVRVRARSASGKTSEQEARAVFLGAR